MRQTADILISGGGVAGLTAAAAFGSAGFRVVCVDPAHPVTQRDADGSDLRSTTFLTPSIAVLRAGGLWDRLEPFATALAVMRIVDAGGAPGEARQIHDFAAADLGQPAFGWNLPNWVLRREMAARLAELPNVSFLPGVASQSVLTRETGALVTLSDGTSWRVCLLVGADGRAGVVRDAAGIAVDTIRYGQKALAFAVTHQAPHRMISTEIHRSGGPFTLVPLQDHQGLPCSAVVWMERGPEALRLSALSVPEFEAAMEQRSCGLLGPLTLASRRTIWPIISQIAARFSAQRTALIAEAAHVVPPIGAQGLNMSLADIGLLLDLSQSLPMGGTEMLTRYHQRRWPEARARLTGIDALNRAAMAGAPIWRDLRGAGLAALYGATPVRKGLMRLGSGVR